MAKANKRRKLSKPTSQASRPAHEDNGEGEDHIQTGAASTYGAAGSDADATTGGADKALPPLNFGVDSTRPTPWDKLPWKRVQLPQIASGQWGDINEGAMLGLEELDGDEWEMWRQQKQRAGDGGTPPVEGGPKEKEVEKVEAEMEVADDHQAEAEPAANGEERPADWKEKRKQEKKARQAAARLARQMHQQQDKKPEPEGQGLRTALGSEPSSDPKKQKTKPQGKDKGKSREADGSSDASLAFRFSCAASLPASDGGEDLPLLPPDAPFNPALLPAWSSLAHPPPAPLLRSLHALGFTEPTPVQAAVLEAPARRDVVAVAETGSGKTLAYGLPFLSALLASEPRSQPLAGVDAAEPSVVPVDALVLTPTRELCLQVRDALDRLLAHATPSDRSPDGGEPKNRTGVHVIAVTGGLAPHKQRRLLTRSAAGAPGSSASASPRGCVVVATPGRLWDLLSEWDALARGVQEGVRWLVIDEADRMTQAGRFEELERCLRLLKRNGRVESEGEGWRDEWTAEGGAAALHGGAGGRNDLRTFVVSATMDASISKNLSKGKWKQRRREENQANGKDTAMSNLLEKVDFRDEEPVLVDLEPKERVAAGLTEFKVECLTKEKDLYLYHFLLRYPGRTLVFLSSIAALRRLSPLLALLLPGRSVAALHSELSQRRRLSSLDAFRSSPGSVLLATDVAARGLDIQDVEHVVHYQVPRSGDGYVHRSGRTARAGKEGVVVSLIGPEELGAWRALLKGLGREDNFPTPPMEHSILYKLGERLELAKRIDTLEHKATKASHDDNWAMRAAEDLGVDLESDEDDDHSHVRSSKKAAKAAHAEAKALRAELAALVKQPVVLKGIKSGKFLTADTEVLETLLRGEGHDQFVGLKREKAAAQAGGGQGGGREMRQNKRKR